MPGRGPGAVVMGDEAVRRTLDALGRHLVAHCPHALGVSEQWRRDDPEAPWRIVPQGCAACAALTAALGLAGADDSRAS